jgi:transcriptional regulator with XRE-family HTH domain
MKSPIRAHREALELSRAELAVLIGVSYTHASTLERCEKQPTSEHLHQLARLFQIEPAALEQELADYREDLRHEAEERITNVGSSSR